MTVRDIIGNIEVQSGHGAEDLEIMYMWCNNDELHFEVRLDDSCEIVPDGISKYTWIGCKYVYDSDGFLDTYTMYKDNFSGKFVFVFGDPEIYSPDDGDFDYECEDEDEAWQWIEDYNNEN